MWQLGIPQPQIDNLEHPDHLTPRQRLALAYTDAVRADANHVPEALFAKLKGAFSDAEIVELTLLIGFINMLNWFNNALQITFHEEYTANA